MSTKVNSSKGLGYLDISVAFQLVFLCAVVIVEILIYYIIEYNDANILFQRTFFPQT